MYDRMQWQQPSASDSASGTAASFSRFCVTCLNTPNFHWKGTGSMSSGWHKIGNGHLEAMARLGLRELRGRSIPTPTLLNQSNMACMEQLRLAK